MAYLLLGLALFFATHVLPMAPRLRDRAKVLFPARMYQLLFSLLSAAALIVIIVGYGQMRGQARLNPELFMIEGEGPFVMHDYCEPSWRDRIAAVAERATGAPLRRGCRARASTDSIVVSHAGYPVTCLCSWEPDTKLMSNYHLMTDVPENLQYGTIERAVDIAEALARDLAGA